VDTGVAKQGCGEVIKILIADDHPVVRKGLVEILTNEIPGVLCGEARTGQEALEEVERRDWDLVIMDITMPGRNGLDALKGIKHARPTLPALVLSIHPEAQYGKRALMAGASGYMNKESAPNDLVRAVRHILEGRLYISPAMGENLAAHLKPDSDRQPYEDLSDREFEVLQLLGSGKTPTQVSEELHLSLTTISTYRARILAKMNMKTTAELMHYAISNNLTD
jgi:DNA-binding NarL/FixJ family response regulator